MKSAITDYIQSKFDIFYSGIHLKSKRNGTIQKIYLNLNRLKLNFDGVIILFYVSSRSKYHCRTCFLWEDLGQNRMKHIYRSYIYI